MILILFLADIVSVTFVTFFVLLRCFIYFVAGEDGRNVPFL